MFEADEFKQCPLCGMKLAAFEKLPPSPHGAQGVDDASSGAPLIAVDPTEEVLPFGYWGRGRGALIVAGVLGFFFFFMPWIHMTLPALETYTGFDIAKRLGWTWGAGVSWIVLLPTVASRRTIFHMRGARVAAAFLSAVPTLTAVMLILRPPHGTALVPVHFTFQWGIWGVIAAGLLGIGAGVNFGGRADDIKVKRGSSAGETLH